MTKPSTGQIDSNLRRLKLQRLHLPQSAFGDDNSGACAAQIAVIEEQLDEGQIYDRWPADTGGDEEGDPASEHKLNSALDCRRWLDGEVKESPADGWEPMYRRATGKSSK